MLFSSKIEIYGLLCALQAYWLYIIDVKNLQVEVDTSYIKGMLNNPDIKPGAVVNRWIVSIKLFQFKLVHVPGHSTLVWMVCHSMPFLQMTQTAAVVIHTLQTPS